MFTVLPTSLTSARSRRREGEQHIGVQTITARHLGNGCAGRKALRDDPLLLISRPSPSPALAAIRALPHPGLRHLRCATLSISGHDRRVHIIALSPLAPLSLGGPRRRSTFGHDGNALNSGSCPDSAAAGTGASAPQTPPNWCGRKPLTAISIPIVPFD